MLERWLSPACHCLTSRIPTKPAALPSGSPCLIHPCRQGGWVLPQYFRRAGGLGGRSRLSTRRASAGGATRPAGDDADAADGQCRPAGRPLLQVSHRDFTVVLARWNDSPATSRSRVFFFWVAYRLCIRVRVPIRPGCICFRLGNSSLLGLGRESVPWAICFLLTSGSSSGLAESNLRSSSKALFSCKKFALQNGYCSTFVCI